jgi:hypothetical protein
VGDAVKIKIGFDKYSGAPDDCAFIEMGKIGKSWGISIGKQWYFWFYIGWG